MTTYRLFPSVNGPASPVSYSGNFISGVVFAVSGDGCWFNGYWWWVANSGQSTSPVKCALWSATSSVSGVLVANSVVTSGTLTAGAWNYIPLPQPLQLAASLDPSSAASGSAYIAAVGCNGNFPDTGSYWSSGITNGPLTAYQGATVTNNPYNLCQGVFSTGGPDPATTMPNGQSGTDNFWVDVQVSDTAPAGYSGSYRLWPNKADTNNAVGSDAALNYTIGTEIRLTQACTLNNLWYYSQSGAVSLATRCDVWNISTGLSAASITAPSWLTASGSAGSAGAGWLKAAFAGGTTLPAGSYRVTVYNSSGTSGSWASKDASTNYWGQGGSGGIGSSGLTWGPLHAPSQPDASSGFTYNAGNSGAAPPYSSGTAINAQPPFGQTPGGTEIFPQLYAPVGAGTNQSQNYWVDLEVTPLFTAGLATASGAAGNAAKAAQVMLAAAAGAALQPLVQASGSTTAQAGLAAGAALALNGALTAQAALAHAAGSAQRGSVPQPAAAGLAAAHGLALQARGPVASGTGLLMAGYI